MAFSGVIFGGLRLHLGSAAGLDDLPCCSECVLFPVEVLGVGIWSSVLFVVARCFDIEHRALGQKRIPPEGWLYNSPNLSSIIDYNGSSW